MGKQPFRGGVILIGLLLVLMCSGVQNTFGQASNALYTGLDVLFLINQSLTTNGSEGLGATDPNGARFTSMQGAVDWLGVYRTQQHLLGNDLLFNVSSVYYGGIYFPGTIETRTIADAAETVLDWTPVAPESFDDWRQQQRPVLDALSDNTFGETHLGMRDHLTGLQAALTQFANGGNPAHRQVIILVTDGKPCAVQYESYVDPNCNSTNVRGRFMDEVRGLVRQRFGETNQSLHVLFLDPQNIEWNANLWSDLNAEPVVNPAELNVRVHDILAQIIRTDLPVNAGTTISAEVDLPQGPGLTVTNGAAQHEIPPYQEMLTVSLFKSNPNSRLVLLINETEVSNAEMFGGNRYVEIWSVLNPPPGELTVSSQLSEGQADPAASVRVDMLPVRFDFDVPQSSLRRYVPVTLNLSAVDSADETLTIYPNEAYLLDADVEILSPGGNTLTLSLEPDRTSNLYTAAFTPLETGHYTATLYATVESLPDIAPPPVTFNVAPVTVEITGMPRQALEDIPQEYNLTFKSGSSTVTDLIPQSWIVTFIPEDAMDCAAAETAETLPDGAMRFDEFEAAGGGATMIVTPETPGDYRICTVVNVLDSLTSDVINIYRVESVSTINLVEGLALMLTRPETRASATEAIRLPEQTTRWIPVLENTPDLPFDFVRPYWEGSPIPLQITVVEEADAELTDGYNPVEIGNDIPTPNEFFTLRVLNAENQQVAQSVRLTQTGNPAVWSAELPSLPAGMYTITIESPSEPIGGTNHAFLPAHARFTQMLEIVPNVERPALLALYGGIALAAVVSVVNFGLIRPTRVRRNRLRGTLYIEAQDDQTRTITLIDRLPFDTGGIRDQWVIPLSQLPLIDPPLTYLEVRMQRGKLRVYYGMQGGEPQPLELTDYRQPRSFGSSLLTPNRRFFFRWDAEGKYEPPVGGQGESIE